jgi:HlyD family secretion protein
VPLGFILAIVAVIIWASFGRAIPVTVGYATALSAADAGPVPVLSGSGYIVTGDRYVSIGVRVPGRIEKYFVEEGQAVHEDDPLVQIDDREYRAQVTRIEAGLSMARANLDLANSELKRGQALRKDGVISAQEFDVLQNKLAVSGAAVSQLQAELAQARVNLEYTVLRAPTDGVVLAKLKEVGEIAVPGGFAGSGDLIRIANLADIRAEVDVNEADLGRVRMGQAAEVTPDAYPDARYRAQVVKFYPQVDRQKGTLKIEVRVESPDAKLLPDMSAKITFLSNTPAATVTAESAGGPTKTVLVPASAVHRDARGDSFVWIVDEQRVRRLDVQTAGEAGDRVRVNGGLHGGETLVLGDTELREGQKVVVREE